MDKDNSILLVFGEVRLIWRFRQKLWDIEKFRYALSSNIFRHLAVAIKQAHHNYIPNIALALYFLPQLSLTCLT